METKLTVTALAMTLAVMNAAHAPAPSRSAVTVTVDNFIRAESDVNLRDIATTKAPSAGSITTVIRCRSRNNSSSVRFDKGKLPPVEAFWSVTAYDTEGYFIPNALKRQALDDHDKLVTNADGSLNLYIQADSPEG